jgi:hypothetical protein
MAISNNILLAALSGSIGDLTIKNYNGRIVVCKKIGKRKNKPTPAQEDNQTLFRAANGVAKKIYADPVTREEARLRLKTGHGNELYRAIIKEFMQVNK